MLLGTDSLHPSTEVHHGTSCRAWTSGEVSWCGGKYTWLISLQNASFFFANRDITWFLYSRCSHEGSRCSANIQREPQLSPTTATRVTKAWFNTGWMWQEIILFSHLKQSHFHWEERQNAMLPRRAARATRPFWGMGNLWRRPSPLGEAHVSHSAFSPSDQDRFSNCSNNRIES